MRASWTPLLALATTTLIGCGFVAPSDLEGDWEGALDCGGSNLPMELEVDEDGTREYEAEGLISNMVLDGVDTEIALRMTIEQPYARGGQVLELDAECRGVPAGGDPYVIDCSDLEELGWDGADTIEADIEEFLGTDTDCELTLER